jgi:catechol 2,3-dioxygenase-like lactoylglutathione lyase family enzyme
VASSVLGIHHVTAIAGDPQQTIDFYTEVLGLRLVKITVDIHDPETYHLFFTTGTGEPGTLLSFHCWPGAIQGRPGTGQIQSTGLGVPPGSLAYWHDRLTSRYISVEGPTRRDGLQSLSFRDRDGLCLDLVVNDGVIPWDDAGDPVGVIPGRGAIPVDRAIRGLHGITIAAGSSAEWERFLTTVLGLVPMAEDDHGRSYAVEGGNLGAHVIVRAMPYVGRGMTTVGFVHHVAFRVRDHELDHWRSRVTEYTETLGPVEDHVYHRALQLEGPEGVRFELASDGPGITIDEAPAELGTHLILPPWLESRHSDLERLLPPLRLPRDTR